MVWDRSGATWKHFGLIVQPASVLVAPTGEPIAVFPRSLSLEEALAAARG